MKRIVALICMVIFSNVNGMEEKAIEFSFSPEENKCFEWFEENKEHAPKIWQNLSEKQKNALHGKSSEDELKEAVDDLVGNVFTTLQEKVIAIPHDKASIVSTLYKMRIAMRSGHIIKPTGLTTARMYTFTHLLTAKEKATVQEKNFLKDHNAANKAMRRYGVLLTKELVKLGLVRDTPGARAVSAQYWHQRKMTELGNAYNKK